MLKPWLQKQREISKHYIVLHHSPDIANALYDVVEAASSLDASHVVVSFPPRHDLFIRMRKALKNLERVIGERGDE